MKTLTYIVLTLGVMAIVIVLGFAGDQFGPFGSMILVLMVMLLFVFIGLTSGVAKRRLPPGAEVSEKQALWAGGTPLANSRWMDLVVDYPEMTRHISLEIDRSRRFGRTFTVIVIAPDLKQLSENGVSVSSASELNALRLFAQEIAVKQLRTTDIVSTSPSQSGTIALLPETDGEGTKIAIDRIRESMALAKMKIGLGGGAELNVSVRAINYPDDVTDTTGFIETVTEFEERVSA